MSEKLIKELLINVKAKGLGPAADKLEKVSINLENAAKGADSLNASLDPIPEALREIVKEAEDIDNVFSNLGKGNDTSKLDSHFEQLDETLNDLIGTVLGLQDAITLNFGNATSIADNNMRELITTIERFEDSTGSASGVTQSLKDALLNIGTSSEKANRGMANTTRTGRGTARTFADIAKYAGPIPGLYAIIAANAFALSEAFRVLSEGDQVNRLEKVGVVLGSKVGVPIQSIARAMQEATGYTISYEAALRQASSAATFGFTSEQIEDMTKAARRASVALGVDMADSMNRIIRGVSKLEIELLDELGITVRLTEAYENYAASINKTANNLTSYEKQQAYLNAVLKESALRQGEVDQLSQATGWEKLGASVSGATTRGKQFLAEFLEPAAREFAAIFDQSVGEKFLKQTDDVVRTLEAAKKSGKRDSYMFSVAGVTDEDLKEIENRMSFVTRQIVSAQEARKKANASGRGISGPSASESSLVSELEHLVPLYGQLKASVTAARAELGLLEDTQLNAAVSASKGVDSWANNVEEMVKVRSEAKGTAESYETLSAKIEELKTLQKDFLATGGSLEDFWVKAKVSEETFNDYIRLQKAMEDAYIGAIKLSVIEAKSAETDRSKSILPESTALKIQQEKISLIEKQIVLAQQSQAYSSRLIGLEAEKNKLIIERAALLRAEQSAMLNQVQQLDYLRVSQQQFNAMVNNTTSEYQRQKDLVALEIAQTEQQLKLAKEQNVPLVEKIALEQKLLESKKKSIDLDKAEMDRLSSSRSDALSTGLKVSDTGPLESLRKQVELAKKETEVADQAGSAFHEQYLQRLKTQLELQAELARAEEDEAARVNNMFLARTGQQDLVNMNMEEQLAYQKEVGMSMYEAARSSLDAFDPVMTTMITNLERFTYSLMQVGDSSQSVWNSVTAGIQAAAGIMALSSQQAISEIDKQIAAEKKRDGQSETSRKKIAQLEAKRQKEEIKGKRISIISSTAAGIMQSFAQLGPWGAIPAAFIAAMGAMQLSALDSDSIVDPGSSNIGKLELGSRENKVDVGMGTTSGELAFIRGQQGVGGIQDFVPRARGSSLSPRVGYITGEHGLEVVGSTSGGATVTSNEEVKKSESSKSAIFQLNISAMDTQSFIDRAGDLFLAVEAEANARGFTLSN